MNLDDENEVEDFIEKFGTMKGLRLARALGLKGKYTAHRANDLSGYAWNKRTAMALRRSGQINLALQYEGICDRIYKGIHSDDKW